MPESEGVTRGVMPEGVMVGKGFTPQVFMPYYRTRILP